MSRRHGRTQCEQDPWPSLAVLMGSKIHGGNKRKYTKGLGPGMLQFQNPSSGPIEVAANQEAWLKDKM